MRKLTLLTVLTIALILTACSQGEGNSTEDKLDGDGTINHYPLTGEKTEKEVDDKAVAVMVSNVEAARQQTGLTKADIVFEMLVESNITRFMAIYQSETPEVVGPVRSAREYFFSLADHYDALYVYSGAAKFINNMIKSREIEHIEAGLYDDDDYLVKRETFRKSPHNMYVQFDAVPEVAEKQGYNMKKEYAPLPFLEEGASLPDGLPYEEGTHAIIDYYGSKPVVEYKYDEDAENYKRYGDKEQTVELETEVPIEIDNLFIVETAHRVIDEEERREIDIESGGDAVLLHKGKSIELQWENKDGRIIPVLDGKEVAFVPGKTWINFVEKDPISGVEEQVKIDHEP